MKFINQGLGIIKLNKKTIENVNDKYMKSVMLFPIIISGILYTVSSISFPVILTVLISLFTIYFIGLGIIHLLSIIFGGKGKFKQLFNVISIANIILLMCAIILSFILLILEPPLWVLISPFVVAGFWIHIVSFQVLKTLHKLSTIKAIIILILFTGPILTISGILIHYLIILVQFLWDLLLSWGGGVGYR